LGVIRFCKAISDESIKRHGTTLEVSLREIPVGIGKRPRSGQEEFCNRPRANPERGLREFLHFAVL